MYYNERTGEILSRAELRKVINASIPEDTEQVGNWYKVTNALYPAHTTAQKVVKGDVKFIDEHYVQMYKVEAKTDAEIATAKEVEEANVRMERDRKLAETDYMLMPDYPIDEIFLEKIKEYRQNLRDIPLQSNFPYDIVWPELPIKESIYDEQENTDSLPTENEDRVYL